MTEPAMTFSDLPDDVVGHIADFTNLSTVRNLSLVAKKYRHVAADVKNNNAFWNQFLTVPVPQEAEPGAGFKQYGIVSNRNEDGLLQDKQGRKHYADEWLSNKIDSESTRDGITPFKHPEFYNAEALQCLSIQYLFIRGELTIKQFDNPNYICFIAIKEQLKATHPTPFHLIFPEEGKTGPYQFPDAQLDELLRLAKKNLQALNPFSKPIFAGKNDKEKLFNAYMERNLTLRNYYRVTSFKDRWEEFTFAVVGTPLIPFVAVAAAMTLGDKISYSFAKWRLNRDLRPLEKACNTPQPILEIQPDPVPAAYAAVSQLPATTTVEIAAQPDDDVSSPLSSAAAAAIQVPTEALSTGSSVDPAASPVPSM